MTATVPSLNQERMRPYRRGKQMSPKPTLTLYLIKGVPTLEQIVNLTALLTGRQPTEDEVAKTARILKEGR